MSNLSIFFFDFAPSLIHIYIRNHVRCSNVMILTGNKQRGHHSKKKSSLSVESTQGYAKNGITTIALNSNQIQKIA